MLCHWADYLLGGDEVNRREWVLNLRDKTINEVNGILEYKGMYPPKASELVHVVAMADVEKLVNAVEHWASASYDQQASADVKLISVLEEWRIK